MSKRLRAALNHCGHPNTVGSPARPLTAFMIHCHWDSIYTVRARHRRSRCTRQFASRRTRMSSMTAADSGGKWSGKLDESGGLLAVLSESFTGGLRHRPDVQAWKVGARHRRDHRHLAFDRWCRSAHTGDRRKGRANGVRNCGGLLSIVILLILLHHTTTTVAVLGFIVGIFWTIGGVTQLFHGFSANEGAVSWPTVILGLIGTIIGVLCRRDTLEPFALDLSVCSSEFGMIVYGIVVILA